MYGQSIDRLVFGSRPASIGRVLVAATKKGVAAVLLGGSEAEARSDLVRRFPRSILVASPSELEPEIGAVLKAIGDPSCSLNVRLDLHGTAFQRRVWTALQAIPAGETRSYRQIADVIGAPRSVRAVAAACAANPVAVLIPCHRVVRADGSLAGYRWGLERKRLLLARERNLACAA
jgi:AraC family transcriptional regulator, regulatory protein of adaptative response / methylated-DNA-[protein]-cysteine methyltransferase